MDDEQIRQYYALQPRKFHDLHRFVVTANRGDRNVDMVLELASVDTRDDKVLQLLFTGVSNFSYKPGYWSFTAIEIVLVQEQWQQRHYRVFEAEQDTEFELTCLSFLSKIIAKSESEFPRG